MEIPQIGTVGSFTVRGVRILGRGAAVDLQVADGVIVGMRESRGAATDLVALPGFVDLHTHLREPGGEASETIASGAAAAAAGGYTDVFAMANTTPVADTVERIEEVRVRSQGARVRVHPVSAATLGQAGEELVNVAALRASGVNIFSDDGHCVTDDGRVFELLTLLGRHGGVFAQHAQSMSIVGDGVVHDEVASEAGCSGWPSVGEEAVIARDIAVARATGGHLHVCHVSTRRSVDLVRWAKSVGAPVSAEVTPHHLKLRDRDALERGPRLKVNPPLRSQDDIVALREALADGTIDAVATDHAPHPMAAKERSWETAAFGLTALETALPVVAEVFSRDGRVDWASVARVMSTAPARLGGLREDTRQDLAVGEPADFCIVQEGGPWPVRSEEHLSKSRNTPFDSDSFAHRVIATVTGGRVNHSISQ